MCVCLCFCIHYKARLILILWLLRDAIINLSFKNVRQNGKEHYKTESMRLLLHFALFPRASGLEIIHPSKALYIIKWKLSWRVDVLLQCGQGEAPIFWDCYPSVSSFEIKVIRGPIADPQPNQENILSIPLKNCKLACLSFYTGQSGHQWNACSVSASKLRGLRDFSPTRTSESSVLLTIKTVVALL